MLAGAALAAPLVACGTSSEAQQTKDTRVAWSAPYTSWNAQAAHQLAAQAAAQDRAAAKERATAAEAAAHDERPASRPGGSQSGEAPQQQQPSSPVGEGGPEQCTTDPADRAACRLPAGAEITPGGGDVDGDGVFETNEPVGPGYKDPRAYNGGKTSGETQCEYLRQQGIAC
ncbi:hypothetical protein [Streptomyces purpurogeneiscleroticus]|uniref:hypothetical protein n=1 Tax=Streptomyces purpurogeneiscleroticus TaxID=68259 RepID=UPI001CBD9C65|nr:hypothetical protein [Streptomyces purpurogeneiscleroticus]